jgi:ABC-type polysaccharide/polyol phosphate export permease
MEGLPPAPGANDTLEPLRHLARLLGRQTARRLHRGLGGSMWLLAPLLLYVALLLAAIMAIAPLLRHR